MEGNILSKEIISDCFLQSFKASSLFPHGKASCGFWNRDKGDYRMLKDPALRAFVYILRSFSSSALIAQAVDYIEAFPPQVTRTAKGWCVPSSCPKQESRCSWGWQLWKRPQSHLHQNHPGVGRGDLLFRHLWCGLLYVRSPLCIGISSPRNYHWSPTNPPWGKQGQP